MAPGGEAALPALLGAIRASGIAVRDTDTGRIVLAPALPSQGLAVQAGEVVAYSRLIARGYQVRLADLAATVRALVPSFPADAPIQRLMVDGLRVNARSTIPTLRFWARTVIDLGKHAPQPYDLATGASADDELNAVQVLFVLLRLFGDLHHLLPPGRSGSPSAGPSPPAHSAIHSVPSCTPGDREAEILDLTGILEAYGFEKLIEYTGKAFEFHGVHRYGSSIGTINAALALIKYIAIFATFNARLEMVGGEPLIRHRSRDPGEVKLIRATLFVDSDPSPFVNCLRLLINGAGLDFSLPTGGPVKEAEVTWTLYAGGQFVRLCVSGCSDGQRPSSDTALSGHTDENGVVDVGMEGNPRRRDLPDDASEVHRTASLRASVNLKPAKIFRDISDAIGTAAIGGVGAPIVFTGELLERIGILGSNHRFAITDFGERYHVVAHLHRRNQSGLDVTYTYTGDIDLDEEGRIIGSGAGRLAGTAECKHYGRVGLDYRVEKVDKVTVFGSWTTTFSGQREGDRLSVGIAGTDITVSLYGLTGECLAGIEDDRKTYVEHAADPAGLFGVNEFRFDPRSGGETTAQETYTEVTNPSIDPGTRPRTVTLTETSDFTITATKI